MKRILLILALAAGSGAAWWVITPGRAVERLRTAVRTADETELAEVIAFDSVRANLRTDLRTALARRAESDDPLASLGVALGGVLADGLIDTFVSPAGLALVLRGRVPGDDGARGEDEADAPPDYRIEREGLGRFAVRFDHTGRRDLEPVLVFRRDGLDWRVVRIRLEENQSDD